MNNEQQTWILKPGIDLRIVDLKDGLSFVHYVDDYVQWETEHVNALFMKLDVAGLTRQIEELLDNYYETRFDVYTIFEETDFHDTKRSHEAKRQAVEQIVLLLLNQERETK
jgi:hypothetical protein